MPMSYVSYSDLIQFCIFIVALIGLVYEIVHNKNKKTAPRFGSLGSYLTL